MPERAPLGLLVLSGVRHASSYLPIFDALPEVTLRALCEEPDAPEWAHRDTRLLAEQYGVPFTTNPETALARADVDLVLVCSEPMRHARLAAQALRAGKHVLVDKPMATTLDECAMLAQAASSAPGKFTIVHRLFSPPIARARRQLDAGHIGLVRSLDIEFLASGVFFGTSVERPEFVADPALSGGGELLNFMVYPVDYLRYLTGAEPLEVFAEAGTFFFDAHKTHGVEDAGIISIQLEHEIVATLTVGRVPFAPTPGSGSSELRILGSHGHLTIDENRPQVQIWSTTTEKRGRAIGGEATRGIVATEIAEFVRDILEDRTPLYGLADGWAAIATIEAAYRAIATGQPARVANYPRRRMG
jgi:myo-inositol 2-dehydrogenase / D-chiro-inositol 1-dehydrogenase